MLFAICGYLTIPALELLPPSTLSKTMKFSTLAIAAAALAAGVEGFSAVGPARSVRQVSVVRH